MGVDGLCEIIQNDTKTSTKSDESSLPVLAFLRDRSRALSTQEQQSAECGGSDHRSLIPGAPVVLSGQESCCPPFPEEVG